MLQHAANRTNNWVRMLLIVCLYFRIKSNMVYPLAASVSLELCNWGLHLLCWDKQVKQLLLLALPGVSLHEPTVFTTLIPVLSIPVSLLLQSITGRAEVERSLWREIPVHPPCSELHKPRELHWENSPEKKPSVRRQPAVPGYPRKGSKDGPDCFRAEMCPCPAQKCWQGALQPAEVSANSSSQGLLQTAKRK